MTDKEKSILQSHLDRCEAYLSRRRQLKKPSRGSILRCAKARLMLEQECRCFWCGKKCRVVARCQNDPHFATVDHYVPQYFGGRSTTKNLRLSCRRCNCDRGRLLNRMIQEKYTQRLWDLL